MSCAGESRPRAAGRRRARHAEPVDHGLSRPGRSSARHAQRPGFADSTCSNAPNGAPAATSASAMTTAGTRGAGLRMTRTGHTRHCTGAARAPREPRGDGRRPGRLPRRAARAGLGRGHAGREGGHARRGRRARAVAGSRCDGSTVPPASLIPGPSSACSASGSSRWQSPSRRPRRSSARRSSSSC